jgi:multimeric flavodoxin WrbA
MKVVAFNGSPHQQGNTYHALRAVCAPIEAAGIETEIIWVGGQEIYACKGCNGCARNRDEKCVLPGDPVNGWIQKLKQADGVLLGSPVHYAGMAAGMKAFLDRAFYVCGNNGSLLRHKVGAAVTAVRRSGGVATVDALYHYLNYSEMLLPTANYWNVIHGLKPGQVEEDGEGMQILEVLGQNMAWLLKLKEYGQTAVPAPAAVKKTFTNFIR